MFDGFETRTIATSESRIHLVIGGAGPPLLLLHGYPQSHVMWHKIAPALAESFTVVAPDLRGYGDSAAPPGGGDHAAYSKRAMAGDQVEIMAALGFERFAVVGHDRGARVGHRMALDHREAVDRLAVLDIVPTWNIFADIGKGIATDYFHWFFLIQGNGFPERLIGADPEYYIRSRMRQHNAGAGIFTDQAIAEYIRCFTPETIHASCEDYRAAASIDLDHDEADMAQPLTCPVLALWGARGAMERHFDVLESWRTRARDVTGTALDCGHFMAEEAPAETLAALRPFLFRD
jgi:haloacetate dehalogenase